MRPRISVLLPAYNAAPYLEAALQSLRDQTFRDFEVVAVDDASTDGTAGLLTGATGLQLRLERNERNLGMTGNWNRCLALATGELVLKLDADDALKPRALELLASALDDPDVIAAGIRSLQCNERLEPFDGIDGDDAMARGGINPYRDAVHEGERWLQIAAHGHQLWSSSAFMVRHDALVALGGWDARFGCASDSDLILRVLESGRRVAHRGEVGTLYRVRPGSISDEYRSRGWLTWEGVAAYLLSLSRTRKKRTLGRALRMHYVRLWERWHRAERSLPPAIAAKLESVMSEIEAPPLRDRLMTRMRDAVSAA